MKKIFKALKFPSIVLLITLSFIACDKDFNSIESDVLGKDNANFNTADINLPILAYNKKLDSLQINGLPSNFLGVFNDPAFGQTTASIITQITPTTFNPDFGDNPEIDQVIISIPYFSTEIGVDNDDNSTYALDSLYGNPAAAIKLTIYQSNYFLRDFNPSSTLNNAQNYYSNTNNNSNSVLTGTSVVNFDNHIVTTIYEDPEFIPSAEAIVLTTGTGDDEVITRSTPAYRIILDTPEDKLYWTNTIINKKDDPVLSNANNFKNYFRGLYFKAEVIGNDGNMILLNLASKNANITIHYSKDSTVEGEDRVQATYVLNFTGNRLNTFINDFNLVTLENGDKVLGDEKIYLKGSAGSMAIVDLFNGLVDCDGDGNVDDDALDCFKRTFRKKDENNNYIVKNGNFVLKKLINEAQLIIYEDETLLNSPSEDYHKYDRIYAYDIKNNAPTIDYRFDPSNNSINPYSSKIVSLGQRIKEESGAYKYKIRITEYLNNILLKDSTNTKLGLVLSINVNVDYNSKTNTFNSTKILNSGDIVTAIPASALITPRGTILYGNHQNVPEDRKMRLELFITDPNL